MKYIDEFRDGDGARHIAANIAAEVRPDGAYNFMEFCGGHTHAISRYGIADMLPANVRMIHGPGCPVCVLPIGRVNLAIRLALEQGVMLCTYGDTMRVPASDGLSLIKAKARGADIRMVYSAADALKLAEQNPQREVVFFAIGFETTTPPTALALLTARAEGLSNFSVYANHVLTPAAMRHLLASGDGVALDGFIGPSHVSTVIGSDAYADIARDSGKPVVITGFEPLDVLIGVRMLIEQINQGRAEVENQFIRAVTATGNRKARQVVDEVFALRPAFDWRGLGEVAASALAIRPEWSVWDAEVKFGLTTHSVADNKACECGAILQGRKKPQDCKVFATVCTPDNPLGACMVSSEGACAAHYAYGRFVSKEPA